MKLTKKQFQSQDPSTRYGVLLEEIGGLLQRALVALDGRPEGGTKRKRSSSKSGEKRASDGANSQTSLNQNNLSDQKPKVATRAQPRVTPSLGGSSLNNTRSSAGSTLNRSTGSNTGNKLNRNQINNMAAQKTGPDGTTLFTGNISPVEIPAAANQAASAATNRIYDKIRRSS